PPAAPAPRSAAPPSSHTVESERAFQRGWSALRAHDFDEAARLFAAVPEDSTLRDDALFWEGVAHRRSGRLDEARRVLEQHRARYPRSAHARDVDDLLAR